MHYVSQKAAEQAKTYAAKFRRLPIGAGVIFISIKAVPADRGEVTTFDVVIGMAVMIGAEAGEGLVSQVLADEISSGEMTLGEVTSVVGYPGAAAAFRSVYEGNEGPHSPSA